MGGMRALEWAIGQPDRVASALVLATGAAATGDQIGTQSAQIRAITDDPNWRRGDYYATGAPVAGLGLARRIAHLTYRSETELDTRFGRTPQPGEDPLARRGGRYAVQSYLDHHADKLVARFDAGSYVSLTDAMNTHDVGRGRGGVASALRSITAPVVIAGIDSDRLYPLRLQAETRSWTSSARPMGTTAS
jgi:homoserine O-acetyltransferase